MPLFVIGKADFSKLLADVARKGAWVYVPSLVGERWTWRKAEPDQLGGAPIELGPARAVEPVKSIIFPPRGEVSRFFGEDVGTDPTERFVVGARACDLAALRNSDFIFLEGNFKDCFYAARREKTFVISADCSAPLDVCFCASVEGRPYAEKGFDLNLSPSGGGEFLVETGSPRGEKFVEEHKAVFRTADDSKRAEREKARESVRSALEKKLAEQGFAYGKSLRRITRGREEDALWSKRAETCVECGACNFACPTCHCFYLLDVQEAGGVRRFAQWDSCLFPKFARVAGGANPRARRAERLLNRFEKKFTFFPEVMDALACTGCGRCVEACAGKIDLREVLKELVR